MARIASTPTLAALTFQLYRVWGRTLSYERQGYSSVGALRNRDRVVFALWHDELFAPCYLHRNEGIIALVSASRDGEFLARILERMGYNLSRGSSTRSGVRALKGTIDLMDQLDKDAVVTVDGPKGPRHQVKDGAVYLAYKSGAWIVPVRVQSSRVKRFHRAWDKFQLPLPGALCKVIYGGPYRVEKLRSASLHQERQRLQSALQELGDSADDGPA
jgi:hypothetical protein